MSGGMQALATARVGDLSPRPPARVGVDDAMWKVVAEMRSKGRGAVLVEEAGALVGIFTERDLLNRDRKSTRLNSSHHEQSRIPSSA